MMKSFTDTAGREWELRINVAAMRRAKEEGVDLSAMIADASLLQRCFVDDIYVADATWAVLSPEAKIRGINRDQFEDCLNGSTIETAREALLNAIAEYQSPGKSLIVLDYLAQYKQGIATALTTLSGSTECKANSDTTSDPTE